MKRVRLFARAIESEARQLRGYLPFAGAKKRYQRWMQQESTCEPYDQTVLLDIHRIAFDGEQGRRLHALVCALTRGGYRVWLMPRICFFQTAEKAYKRQALKRVFHLGDPETPENFDLCITDRKFDCPVASRTVRLTGDINRRLRPDELAIPYTMHPDHLENGEDQRLERYRNHPRRWLLFFGGYNDPKHYHASDQYGHFTTLPRTQVTGIAQQCFQDRTCIPENADQLDRQRSQDFDGLVILDSSKYRTPSSGWLDLVSHSKFFLAAPGTTYPVCHNCVESLAVGTIPILEYAQLFQPALQHGVNCLIYRGESELRQLMSDLPLIDAAEVQRLSRGAAKYYDDHLSATAFVQKLADDSVHHLHMFAYLAMPSSSPTKKKVASGKE
jgi:hypothetical protein